MRRFAFAAVILAAVSALAAGCFDTSPVYHPTGAECGGLSYEDAELCEGGVCLGLGSNAQNMAGLCSEPCTVDAECGGHERCESITFVTQEQGSYCFRSCDSDDDCYDKFVCRLLQIGGARRYCLVDPG